MEIDKPLVEISVNAVIYYVYFWYITNYFEVKKLVLIKIKDLPPNFLEGYLTPLEKKFFFIGIITAFSQID